MRLRRPLRRVRSLVVEHTVNGSPVFNLSVNAVDPAADGDAVETGVTAGVDAIVYFRVIDSPKAVLETTNYFYATSQFAQAALRDVTGNFELDDLLSKREEISQQIKEIVDKQTDQWGIDVEAVKIQNIELPSDMKRAMAKQAEAERERRSNIINAEGERAAAETLAEAARIIASTPGAINLRTLNTVERISTEPSQKTTILFPVELLEAVKTIGDNMKR